MEHFFHRYAHWLRHHVHKLKRSVSHQFHSKNARLAIILIIAAAIPLTVLGVQQIQDIRQSAKEAQACDGSKLLKVTNDTDFALGPFTDGQGIIFSHTDGKITDNMYQEEDFTGNGATACTYDSANGWIRCKAKYNGSKEISDHTWTFRDVKCNYQVKDKPKPTKDPKKTPVPGKGTPGHTPVSTATPKANEGCEGNLTANSCTADKKPRFNVTWNIKGGSTCSVKVGGVEISKDCSAANKVITDLNGKVLESDKSYDLVISSNGATCKDRKADTEKTAKCATTGGTPTPTQKPGTTNPTPTPSKLGPPDGESIKASCKGTQSAPKITVSWNKVTLAKKYIANLRTSQGGSVVKTETTENLSATLEGIRKDQKYFYSVISVDAAGKKSEESKVSSDRTITCTNSNLQTPGSAGANSLGNPNCPGGVCP